MHSLFNSALSLAELIAANGGPAQPRRRFCMHSLFNRELFPAKMIAAAGGPITIRRHPATAGGTAQDSVDDVAEPSEGSMKVHGDKINT